MELIPIGCGEHGLGPTDDEVGAADAGGGPSDLPARDDKGSSTLGGDAAAYCVKALHQQTQILDRLVPKRSDDPMTGIEQIKGSIRRLWVGKRVA